MPLLQLSDTELLSTEHIILAHDDPVTETLTLRLSDGTAFPVKGELRPVLMQMLGDLATKPPKPPEPPASAEKPDEKPDDKPQDRPENAPDEPPTARTTRRHN